MEQNTSPRYDLDAAAALFTTIEPFILFVAITLVVGSIVSMGLGALLSDRKKRYNNGQDLRGTEALKELSPEDILIFVGHDQVLLLSRKYGRQKKRGLIVNWALIISQICIATLLAMPSTTALQFLGQVITPSELSSGLGGLLFLSSLSNLLSDRMSSFVYLANERKLLMFCRTQYEPA